MEKNNLYKTISFNSFTGNNSGFKSTLSPRLYNSNKSSFFKKNKHFKINPYNKTYKYFPKLSSTANNSPAKLNINFQKYMTGRVFCHNKSIKEEKKLKNELSVSIFQNNDVDLVRSLNPDSNKDLCSNLLLKEQLKNKIEPNLNISILLNTSKNKKEGKKQNLPNIKKISIEGIIESERKIKNFRKELLQSKQNHLLEKDLNKKLKQIKEISSLKKQNKDKIYDNLRNKAKEIDNISYDIQYLTYKSNETNSQLRRESKLVERNNKRRRSSIKINNLANLNYNDILNFKKKNNKNNINNNELSAINRFNYNNNSNINNTNNLNEKDDNNKLNIIQTLYQDKKKKDFQKRLKQEKIGELKKEIKQLKIPLKSINLEITELKNVEKNIKQKLMNHYKELLYNGKEIRNEGLAWIIKAIWKLGENVPMSFMPTFLDFNGIKYLFNMACLSIELESKKKFIIELKSKLKEELSNFSTKKEKDNDSKNKDDNSRNSDNENEENKSTKNCKKIPFIFKTDLLFQNKNLSHSSSQPKFMRSFYHLNKNYNIHVKNNLNYDNEEIFRATFREMSKIFDEDANNFSVINLPSVNLIKNLEKKVKQIEIDIKNMKKYEIKRIFKEFIDNDYENKYNTTIDVVLGALFGEHLRNIQVNNYNAYKKGHIDEIKNIRFYEYCKRNGWIV